MLLVLIGIFFISCDQVDRHKVLTFFFDGVPPLGPEGFQEELLEPNFPVTTQADQTLTWYVHEPTKDCSTCHGKRKQRGFTSQIYLTAPVPKLCYECHDDYTVSVSFVHGPVAVGQCLLCHNQHKSKIKHLLIAPEPELCYQCHDKNTIELIAAHSPEQLSSCTNCHNAHASSNRALLKDNSFQISNEYDQSQTPVAASDNHLKIAKKQDEQRDSEQGATSSPTASEGMSFSVLFRETSRLIELSELKQAKALLEKYKDSPSFTAEQRGQIVLVLDKINSVINGTEQQPENDKKAKEIADLYYSSMAFYRTGQLTKAREGFVKILKSGLIPESMAKTIRGYISDIDNSLTKNETPKEPKQ
jgi:predicted CXXCH cytochrome family protein